MRVFFMFLVLAATVFVSCSGNDVDTPNPEPQMMDQTWTLVRMAGSFEGSTQEGSAMEWQEEYRFFVDGHFNKLRMRQGDTLRAMGTFEAVEYDNDVQDYLELSFSQGTPLAGSCFGNDKELLRYLNDTTLISTWQECDGPGLEYVLQQH